MAGLHADNFGWYTTSQKSRVYTVEAENGAITVGAFGRSGGPGLQFSGDVDDAISRALSAASGATAIHEIDITISAYPAADTPILQITQGGAVQVALFLNTDGKLEAYRGEGGGLTSLGTESTYVLPLNEYTRLAVKVLIHASAGTFTVTSQGPGDLTPVSVLALTGLDTLETGSATWDGIVLLAGCDGSTGYCNWVVKDGSGAAHNDLRGGPQNVLSCLPDGNGAHSEWDRSTGVDQFATIDDPTADDDVTYNAAESADLIDTLAMADSPAPDAAISFVVLAIVAKNAGGSEALAHVVRQGSTDTISSGVVMASTYTAMLRAYQTLPDATAWGALGWNAVEAGYKRTA